METKISIPTFPERIKTYDLNNINLAQRASLMIQYICYQHKLSLFRFAMEIDMNVSYLNDVVHCRKKMTIRKVETICQNFNISSYDFFNLQTLIDFQNEMKKSN